MIVKAITLYSATRFRDQMPSHLWESLSGHFWGTRARLTMSQKLNMEQP